MCQCLADTAGGERAYSQCVRGQLGPLSGQAFYILVPKGNGGGSSHKAQARPHEELPGAFSLTIPAFRQLGEDLESERWAEDIRPIPKAQRIQDT